jgi:hypothetical protein
MYVGSVFVPVNLNSICEDNIKMDLREIGVGRYGLEASGLR